MNNWFKRGLCWVTVLALVLACGTAVTEQSSTIAEDDTIVGEWIDVRNEIPLVFNEDGTGDHNGTSISYSVDSQEISIYEGVASITPIVYSINEMNGIMRLIPGDKSTFYVRSENYAEIGEAIRNESIGYLTSVEFWKMNAKAINYITFGEGGSGWFLLTSDTYALNWEMLDNDTVLASVDYNGGQSIVLNIVNQNGSLQLVNNQGVVAYIPKQ
jgi:hypothetical protein